MINLHFLIQVIMKWLIPINLNKYLLLEQIDTHIDDITISFNFKFSNSNAILFINHFIIIVL